MELPVVDDPKGEKPWYAEGLRFSCTQCGNCCTGGPGYVWIAEVEIALLAKHLSLTVEQTLKQYCRRVGSKISLKEHLNPRTGGYDCVFLKEQPAASKTDGAAKTKRVCAIYAARPAQCRSWPFWKSNLSSPKAWELAGKNCPGMGRGQPHDLQKIEAARDQTTSAISR